MTQPSRKTALAATTFFLPVVVAFVLFEVYLRYFSASGYLTPAIIKERYAIAYEPSVISRYVLPAREQHLYRWNAAEPYLYINPKGFRGRDFPASKPPGVTRIMIYGGSAVFDAGRDEGADWPHQIEARLREAGFADVEVINAGVPGNTSIESFARLVTEGHLYEPDYVALYNAWNDLKYFPHETPILRVFRPYDPHKDARLNYRNVLDRWLSNLSQTYVRIRQAYYEKRYDRTAEGVQGAETLSSTIAEVALRQYHLNLSMFADAARNIGAEPLFIIQARLVSPENGAAERARIQNRLVGLTHEALLRAFREADAITERVAREKGAVLLRAGEGITGNPAYFGDHVHLSEAGSAALARAVAAELEAVLRRPL